MWDVTFSRFFGLNLYLPHRQRTRREKTWVKIVFLGLFFFLFFFFFLVLPRAPNHEPSNPKKGRIECTAAHHLDPLPHAFFVFPSSSPNVINQMEIRMRSWRNKRHNNSFNTKNFKKKKKIRFKEFILKKKKIKFLFVPYEREKRSL